MGMLWPTLETLLGVAIVIVLMVGGREVLQHRITVGSFVAFNTYMVQLTWPIIALGWVINIFQRGTASMGRIHNILSKQPEITDAGVPATNAPREIRGDIEFRNLSFHYGQTLQAAEKGEAAGSWRRRRSAGRSVCAYRPAPAWQSSVRLAPASRLWFR